ncbi:hypothetical protein M0805_007946 [Coniferiporia weirii]|nr:hypothetical protein M0805_007946 [Coniferiporia weirii]
MSHIKLPDFKKLNAHNWGSWSQDMKAYFMVYNIKDIVDGTATVPTNTAELATFNQKCTAAAGIITLMVEPVQCIHFKDHQSNPKEMWSKLKNAFHQCKPLQHFNALEHLINLWMKAGDKSYTQFAARIEEAMQDIQALCDSSYTITDFDNEMVCASILCGLPDSQANLKQSLLMMRSLKVADLIEALTLEEASTHTSATDIANQATASPSSGSGFAQKRQEDRPKLTCYYCGKDGHGEHSCCAKKEDSDRRKKQAPGEAKAASSAQADSAPAPTATVSTAVDAQVVHFAGNASTHDFSNPHTPLISDASTDWITDTGATCHMTPHWHWFFSYSPQRAPVKLTNNCVVYSAGIGSVRFQSVVDGKLGTLLEFHHVSHVPDL